MTLRPRCIWFFSAALLLACSGDPAADVERGASAPTIRLALARVPNGWVTHSTEHVQLYARRGSLAAQDLPRLARIAEAARANGLALLEEPAYPRTIELLLVGSRQEMQSAVGYPAGGWALPEERAAILVHNSTSGAPLYHEIMHVLSWELWGIPHGGTARGQWLSEGVALMAAGGCQAAGLHALAAAGVEDGMSWPLERLAEQFDPAIAAPSFQSGSVMKFVREQYGVQPLRLLWQEGLAGFSAATGVSPEALEGAWSSHVGSFESVRLADDDVRSRGCESTPRA